MNKTVRNFVIALAVGGSIFVAGQVITAETPEADVGRTTTMMAIVAGSATFAGLNARKGNRKLPTASGESRAAALAFPLREGTGYIVVMRSKGSKRSLGIDLMLDDAFAAQLMAAQFVVLPVASGTHSLFADHPSAPGKSAADPREVAVAPGAVLFFEMRSAMGLTRSSVHLDRVPDTPDLRARLGRIAMVMPAGA